MKLKLLCVRSKNINHMSYALVSFDMYTCLCVCVCV